MSRSIDSATLAALQARAVIFADFLWITAKDRTSGAPYTYGLWSDFGPITAPVIDGTTGLVVNRDYIGSGPLVAMDAVPSVNTVDIQNLNVTTSALTDAVTTVLRQYDADQAPVEIHRGLFNPSTNNLVAPAVCRFVGFVDSIKITTAKEKSESTAVLTLASHSQEMTRSNPAVRSSADQKLRSATDTFYDYTAVVGDWTIFWGEKAQKISDTVNKSGFSDIAPV